MASRQEEKERRRQARLERERAEAAAAARRARLRLALAGIGAVAVAALVVVGVVAGLGGGGGGAGEPGRPAKAAGVKLPQQQTSDLTQAAKAAGCTLKNPPLLPAAHDTKDFKASDYNTNPPTSGPHNPQWYQDGIYSPGDTPRLGMLVHPLEHGRIEVQYRPGTPKATEAKLEALLAEQSGGYHMLLFQNTTGMPYAVAATAWGHLLGCPTMNDGVFDALRTFRERYVDKGPERVP